MEASAPLRREAEVDEVLRHLLGRGAWGPIFDRRLLTTATRPEQHRVVVLDVQVRDELKERILQVRRHLERHAPVEDAELAVRRAQQIARVRVAVQHA